ncbi:MAG: VWA domain-containing protein [Bacteroidetes bacterium]|nr:VWA domain-containing protein [Bacteroidota bacterium]
MIRFEHTEYLYLLLLIPVFAVIFALMMYWKKQALKRFGNPDLLTRLMPDAVHGRHYLKFIILMIAFGFLVLGIANPQTGSRLEKIKRKGIDIMIALDVSNSMLAQDIRPDRLSRAKQAIGRLIDKLDGDRIGIIVFAGNAYMQLPITTDYAAAKLFLSTINTEIVPSQGTAIGEALRLATGAFSTDDKHNKAIIVITDGENHEGDAVEEASEASALGIRVFTIGMGLPEGAPIPVYNAQGDRVGYKKDRDGQTIVTRLNVDMLRQIASAGDGIYVNATNSNTGLDDVLDEINRMEKTELETRMFADYEDQFQYFIGIALILFLAEFLILERKGRWARKFRIFETKKA